MGTDHARGRGERRRTAVRRLGLLFVVVGVLGVVECALTVVWQEPFSSLAAMQRQSRVDDEVRRLLRAPVPAEDRRALARLDGAAEQLAFRAKRAREATRRGRGLGRLEIPAIDVDLSFVHGTDGESLERGPGHYERTDLPGQPGTIGIAGHRTTYGAPFRHIDKLRRGDRILVRMPYGTFTYEVERTQVVTPDRVDVVKDVGRPRLVLSACTPLFSSAKRIIVFARQTKAVPAAPGAPA